MSDEKRVFFRNSEEMAFVGESARLELTVNLNDQTISSWISIRNGIEMQRTDLQQCIERRMENIR